METQKYLKYITFSSTEDFEKWQESTLNAGVRITQTLPVVNQKTNEVNVFITYVQ